MDEIELAVHTLKNDIEKRNIREQKCMTQLESDIRAAMEDTAAESRNNEEQPNHNNEVLITPRSQQMMRRGRSSQ
jgi:hypothetical protein